MREQVTRLRRAYRYAEADRLVDERLDGADAAVERGRIAAQQGRLVAAAEHFAAACDTDPTHELAQAWRVAVLSRQRRYDEARAVADEVLSTRPDAHLVRIARGRIADDEIGDDEHTLEATDVILTEDPDHLEALEWRIATLKDLGRHDEAEEAGANAVKRHPAAPELFATWANAAATAGRLADAIDRFDEALRIQPDYADAIWWRAGDLLRAQRYTEAMEEFASGVERCPDAGELYQAWGTALLLHDEPQAAYEKLSEARRLSPDDPGPVVALVYTLLQLGRSDEARDVIRSGHERCDDKVPLLVVEAAVHHRAGAYDSAVTAVRAALDLSACNRDALYLHVFYLRQADRLDEAIAAGLTAVEIRPRDNDLLLELASAYVDRGQYEDALVWLRKSLESPAAGIETIEQTAYVLRLLSRPDDAEEVVAEGAVKFPGRPEITQQLALAHGARGSVDRALAAYTDINATHPDYLSAWYGHITVLRERHRHAEAEEVADRAIAANPTVPGLRYSRAQVHQACGDDDEAIAEMRRACEDHPYDEVAKRRLSWVLRDAGEYDEAWEILAGLTDSPQVVEDRIAHLKKVRRYEEAITTCTAAMRTFPEAGRLRIELADLKSELDDDEGALAGYEEVLATNPWSVRALRGKARSLRALRRYAESERLLSAEVARRPHIAGFQLDLAYTYAQAEKRDKGLAQYRKALRIKPRDPNLHLNHADALQAAGRWDEAEEALRSAIELFPDDVGLAIQMGELLDSRNKHEEALTWYDAALDKVPRNEWALRAKSAALRSLGRFDAAERLLEPALARPTAGTPLLVEWGWVLRDRGQHGRARRTFERALEDSVGHWARADVLHCLGWVAFDVGEFDLAARRFRQALAEHADSIRSKVGLAWTLVHDQRPNGEAEAERLCLEVLDFRPRNHMAHTCLGILYARQGNLPQAEHHLRRSLELDPYRGSYVDLAALFVQMDRFDEAEELLRKALERNWYDTQAHIEMGGLHLQRDFQDGESAREAARHFRQALAIDPARGAAAIGLSLALLRAPGDLIAAERVLRDALERRDCDHPRWQLLVALARLLIERGDAGQRRDLHLEALGLAQEAIDLAADQADPHYVAGVAAYKAGDSGTDAQVRPFYRRRAVRYFRWCLAKEPSHVEARRVMNLAEQSLALARRSLIGSAALVVVASGLLVALWAGFFLTDKVTTVVIGTLTPILVGLVAVALVLPFLVRLKLPGGVEADLSASLSQVTSGPTGEVTIGPGRLVSGGSDGGGPLAGGPRGELPRLG